MFGYGFADFFAKKAVDRIGNLKALIYSQLFAGVLTAIYFFRDASFPDLKPSNILIIVAFGFFNTVGYLALYRAFQIGKLSVVSPISSTFVVLAAVISFLFFGEIFSQTKIIALVLVVVGIVFTSVNLRELRNGIDISDLSKGVPEALLVFLIFGFYVPFWDRFI
ncbi:MAG: hypothetical protein UW60_C0012G0036 [Candidatus Woesebacteria bacterium GW2011_GWA2_44_33]|uniref:EamA domain-containing protein n=3 Tax=Microgenomates group TaxID=1794810 RepID=A0A0G1NB00_9BACT|nr:MAG: hypothetical protein UW60_C0012G0036 [Candidatus Woesebacteria bacterium GW2011_GWA2_44_33]KKT67831.1 MAG: hypothetical protein UW61_C0002G0009 [Candidatus Curtissbacteria bacterium GW2011_GWC1_44_33]KKU17714.1 MAG: hypothetical protein UX25_C0002G0008 [Candidatus Woesebacteria bacterium GW2011_GWC2_45_9]